MPIDTSGALLQVQPLNPIQLGAGPNQNLMLEQQRLMLMQQEFEETKRKNAEQQQLARMEEAGRTTREQMVTERMAAERAAMAQQVQAGRDATAEAVTTAQKREAFDQMDRYRAAGDYAGMETQAQRINQLGGIADRLGEDPNGLPSYRIQLDPEAARAEQAAQQAADAQAAPAGPNENFTESLNRLSALGYDTTGARTPLNTNESPSPLSTTDAFQQARAASRQASETGAPARPPDAPDFMGAVPKDVLDTGALAAQTLRRLKPALSEFQASYPEAYRESVGHTNAAAEAMGLPAEKALERAAALRTPADAATEKELAYPRALDKEAQKRQDELDKEGRRATRPLTPIEERRLTDSGIKAAHEAYGEHKIQDSIATMESAKTINRLLDDKDPLNNEKAINFLMIMAKNKGHQSEADALRMTGLSTASTVEQIRQWVQKHLVGGYDPNIRASLKRFASSMSDADQANTFSYVDSMLRQAHENPDARVGRGYQEALDSMPAWVLDAYDAAHPDAEKGTSPAPWKPEPSPGAPGAPAPSGQTHASVSGSPEFEQALDRTARSAGLDPAPIRKVIGPESGGDPTATNARGSGARGILQIMPDVAPSLTNPRTGKPFANADEVASLPATEQLAPVMQYFKDRGINEKSPPEDYALAVAAPGYIGKSRDTVISQYRAGTKFGDDVRRKNPAWIPKGGGDITVGSILDFYGYHGSGGTGDTGAKRLAGADDAKLLEGVN